MKETMPEISFERSMNHNYMILRRCSFFGKNGDNSEDYRTKMLLENRIPGLLPVTHRLINKESCYYYEINSLQSLDRLYEKIEIRYDALRQLLSGCVSLFDRLEEYLLDGTQIIMKSEMIYIDVEKMEPYFVCYPDYEGDVRQSFAEFIDELLTRIDHTDERAVMISYQIYRYTRNPNYVISEIGSMMGHAIGNMDYKKTDSVQRDSVFSKDDLFSCENKIEDCRIHYSLTNQTDRQERTEGQKCFTAYPYDESEEEDIRAVEKSSEQGIKYRKDLLGGILCMLVSLCAGIIVLGSHIIPEFKLSGNGELYLYGAMGMAMAAAALFFSCDIKKRRQSSKVGLPDDSEDFEQIQYDTPAENTRRSHRYHDSQPQGFLYSIDQMQNKTDNTQPDSEISNIKSCSETVFLGGGVVEERVLCGRINGKEVNISLDRLPMTVGKFADVSDVVINDASVSKMHARFEERDGRVYVCDLNSTNGTVRNGELLELNQSVALEPGDRLRFGRTCFTYC
ncbi:MAG: FHA domain-containing protein [Lachnospiraceae bacterium]|nr:FHA domain-containing protein [Lachnospiraceae bacterium]